MYIYSCIPVWWFQIIQSSVCLLHYTRRHEASNRANEVKHQESMEDACENGRQIMRALNTFKKGLVDTLMSHGMVSSAEEMDGIPTLPQSNDVSSVAIYISIRVIDLNGETGLLRLYKTCILWLLH